MSFVNQYTHHIFTSKYIIPFIAGLLLFFVYASSTSSSVLLEDDAYFVLASYFNGVAHPPGYPLYTLIGNWFSHLPIDTVAFRIHLLSASFATLSCMMIWFIVNHLLNSRFMSTIAASGYGLSSVFWSQAIIAEVYTFNTFLFFILFYFAISFKNSWTSKKIFLFTVVYGLSISNHWPLLVLSTPALLVLLWSNKNRFLSIYTLLGLMLGLLPYLWMVVNSQSETAISFFGPISSWSDFWFYFSREAYAQQDVSVTAGLLDKLKFVLFFLTQCLVQFGYFGCLLGIIGLVVQWKKIGMIKSTSLLLCFLGNSVLLILLLDFDYDLWHQNIFRVYPLTSYAVLMIWIVIGAKYLQDILEKKPGYRSVIFQTGLAAILIVSILPGSLQANNRANDNWSTDYARQVLDSLDQNAILFTFGDLDQGALVYLNLVEQYRTDVDIYSSKGVLLANRLFFPMYHDASHIKQALHEFISRTDRPVYYTYGLDHEFKVNDYGIVKQLVKDENRIADKAILNEDSIQYLNYLLGTGLPQDPWKSMHYKQLMNDYCRLLLKMHMNHVESHEQNEVKKVCSMYPGKLEHIEALLNNDSPNVNQLAALLDEAEKLRHQSVLKADNARLEFYRGMYLQLINEQQAANDSFQQALKIWGHPDNPAHRMLR